MYGMCHQRSRFPATQEPEVQPERRPDERVTDADRETTADLLSIAFRDGVIRVDEFDQRLSAVYAAATVADLDTATSDLPQDWVRGVRAAETAERRSQAHRRRWRAEVRTYLRVMALLVGIWVLTYLAAGGGPQEIPADPPHFWPIWPMLGWGIPLFLGRPRGPIAQAVRRRRMVDAR